MEQVTDQRETRGLTDGWVVKVTAKGVKSWEKSYGGSDRDYLYDGAPTDDGGYLLAGYSQSDASAEKSANSKGGYDYWVVKIDSRGNKIWDKTLGGIRMNISVLLPKPMMGDIYSLDIPTQMEQAIKRN